MALACTLLSVGFRKDHRLARFLLFFRLRVPATWHRRFNPLLKLLWASHIDGHHPIGPISPFSASLVGLFLLLEALLVEFDLRSFICEELKRLLSRFDQRFIELDTKLEEHYG